MLHSHAAETHQAANEIEYRKTLIPFGRSSSQNGGFIARPAIVPHQTAACYLANSIVWDNTLAVHKDLDARDEALALMQMAFEEQTAASNLTES